MDLGQNSLYGLSMLQKEFTSPSRLWFFVTCLDKTNCLRLFLWSGWLLSVFLIFSYFTRYLALYTHSLWRIMYQPVSLNTFFRQICTTSRWHSLISTQQKKMPNSWNNWPNNTLLEKKTNITIHHLITEPVKYLSHVFGIIASSLHFDLQL